MKPEYLATGTVFNLSNSRRIKLKERTTKYIVFPCSFNWLMNLLLNSRIAMRDTALDTNRHFTKKLNVDYCSSVGSGGSVASTIFILDLFHWCFLSVYHGLDHYLHGEVPLQAQEASPIHPQWSEFSESYLKTEPFKPSWLWCVSLSRSTPCAK